MREKIQKQRFVLDEEGKNVSIKTNNYLVKNSEGKIKSIIIPKEIVIFLAISLSPMLFLKDFNLFCEDYIGLFTLADHVNQNLYYFTIYKTGITTFIICIIITFFTGSLINEDLSLYNQIFKENSFKENFNVQEKGRVSVFLSFLGELFGLTFISFWNYVIVLFGMLFLNLYHWILDYIFNN